MLTPFSDDICCWYFILHRSSSANILLLALHLFAHFLHIRFSYLLIFHWGFFSDILIFHISYLFSLALLAALDDDIVWYLVCFWPEPRIIYLFDISLYTYDIYVFYSYWCFALWYSAACYLAKRQRATVRVLAQCPPRYNTVRLMSFFMIDDDLMAIIFRATFIYFEFSFCVRRLPL